MNSAPASFDLPRDLTALVVAVFARWRAEGIAFLVLRNYENLPHETGNDIDVLVLPEQLARAEQSLIQAAQSVGYRLHNRAEFSPVSLFFFHPDSLQQIQFDLFHELAWRGFKLQDPRALLERRVERDGFAVPHPADEAVNSLVTRLIYQGAVKEKYHSVIRAGFQNHPLETAAQLTAMFGASLAGKLAAAVAQQNWRAIAALHRSLRRQLIWRRLTREPMTTVASWVKDLRRFTGRLRHPPGWMVVLVGADGCGKSTAAEKLSNALRGTFHPNKSLRVHWKPAVFLRQRRAARPPTTAPHALPPRNALITLLILVYHWIEFCVGAFVQFLPVQFRNGLILIDRYHYDFVVDPRRFRLAAWPWFARTLFRLLPKPDRVLVLDAPPEVLQSRKREVPLAETARQREAYRRYPGELPFARIVDASQPADDVASELARETLNGLAARQARRQPPPAAGVSP
ncbi:MAG: hypothetical protein IH623_13230 [Verrucomicrobia bacterium]|nr:hypothetical protein [Verrucomicrobiota bacterium]